MRVRFWGTRGSIPKPGPLTIRYGGNTSCVEVRTAGGTLIVLDCGTGAHGLGEALLADPQAPRRGHLLIGHTHWDHIQGLPFMGPLFSHDFEWDIYGPRGLGPSIRETLAGQMRYEYFPISLEQFAAEVHYHDLVEGSFEVDDVRVTAHYLNHPALALGYRIEADGATLVYSSDHEPHSPELARGDRRPQSGEEERHEAFIAGADLLIHDTQFTGEEYEQRVGWGHSPVEFAVDSAIATGARRLALYHHDPLRDDDALDVIVEKARARAHGHGLDVFGAAEGLEIEITGDERSALSAGSAKARGRQSPSALDHPVLLAVSDPAVNATLTQAIIADGLPLLLADDPETVLRLAVSEAPSLVLLERDLGGRDALDLCAAIRDAAPGDRNAPVTVVVSSDGQNIEPEQAMASGVTDWLVWPFKETYARTRVHCWVMRTACHWATPPVPVNEDTRLAALRRTKILDTEPEDRFDRFTRIASALFEVPISLVSLVDAERQWFKSHHGLDASETPREMAFCAHAILGRGVLQVCDALHDPRFSDNPLVTGPPHIRFYAGAPLVLSDGSSVGTLCLIDIRPRELDAKQVALLTDMSRLVAAELESGA